MKKTISILLIVMMVLSVGLTGLLSTAAETGSTGTPAAQAEEPVASGATASTAWEDYVPKANDDSSWAGWTGVETYGELIEAFKARTDTSVELKVYLKKSLDIDTTNWQANDLKNLSVNFVLDGNGNSFNYESGDAAVFFNIKTATIKNLKLTGNLTLAGGKNSPLGNTYGSNGTVTLDNVYSDIVLTGANADRFKAMSGVISQVGDGSSFTDVVFAGSLTTQAGDKRKIDAVGGILGICSSGTVTFTDCYTSGSITIPEGSTMFGYSYKSSASIGTKTAPAVALIAADVANATFVNCYTSGSINIAQNPKYEDTTSPENATAYVGALAGTIAGTGSFTNCTNAANIKTTAGAFYAGGLVGATAGATTMTNCLNSGDVTGTVYVGGIAASVAGGTVSSCSTDATVTLTEGSESVKPRAGMILGSGNQVLVSGCDTYGSFVIEDLTTEGEGYIGGIVGHNGSNPTMQNCVNNATISVSNADTLAAIGGILGRIGWGTNGKLSGCTNNGAITVDSDVVLNGSGGTHLKWGVGGVLGNGSGTLNLENCGNTGVISASTDTPVGGIVGYAQNGTITATDCSNSGAVKGSTTVGGLVGYVESAVTFEGTNSNSGTITGKNVGGIIGIAKASIGATVSNLINSGNVTGTNYSGGIISYINVETTFENCHNTGNVTDTYRAGGIVGWAVGTTTYKNCTNGEQGTAKAAITANGGDTWSGAAGIVGYVQGAATLENCVNYGAVSGGFSRNANDVSRNHPAAGGLVGNATNTVSISGSTNEGDVSATGPYAGGLLGYMSGTGENVVTITTSYNSGDVTNTNTSVEGSYAGGFVGYSKGAVSITGTAAKPLTNSGAVNGGVAGGIVGYSDVAVSISNCSNSGAVSGKDAGGIVGKIAVDVEFNGLTNSGDISGTGAAGGILGWSNSTVSLIGCENSGDITASTSAGNAGGIIGASAGAATINNCKNTGAISTEFTGGGIAGWLKTGSTVTNCTNGVKDSKTTATVSATAGGSVYIGGIAGAHQGAVEISGCTNYANVTYANAKYAGGIVGELTGSAICKNNHNYGDVSGNIAGGILGQASSAITIENCSNSGNVTGTNYAGGFVGSASAGVTIKGTADNLLTNTGNISADKYAGGIVGKVNGASTLQYLKNTGKIVSTQTSWDAAAGGILGNSSAAGTSVTYCYNEGNIEVAFVGGGIVGYYCNAYGTVTNCVNGVEGNTEKGKVTATATGAYIGGIIGSADKASTVGDCVNYGAVTAKDGCNKIGGILAQIGNGYLYNCTNHGAVTAGGSVSVGGIAGELGTLQRLENINNTGSITGGGNVGGIIGNYSGTNVLTGSTNSGAVSGNIAGGIVGYAGDITITGCTNTANITTTHRGGGIVGAVKGSAVITDCVNGDKDNIDKYLVQNLGYGNTGSLGGIVGYIDGALKIDGCYNYAKLYNPRQNNATYEGAKHVGGIVGWADNAVAYIGYDVTDVSKTGTGCFNYGSIETAGFGHTAYIGGIVGYAAANVYGCENYGDISLIYAKGDSKSSVHGAGGIMGYNGDHNLNTTIKNCDNYGDITCNTTTTIWTIGGILGGSWNRGEDCMQISDCNNNGILSGTPRYAGGIAGRFASPATVANCNNNKDVTCVYYGGGIVGFAEGSDLEVTNCNNIGGKVTSNSGWGSDWVSLGGIVGKSVGTTTISECENTGAVEGTKSFVASGGIIGYFNSANKLKIEKCINRGDVSVVHGGWCQGVGGIAGYLNLNDQMSDDKKTEIIDCENYGVASSNDKNNWCGVAGIVGYLLNGNAVIKDCENYADLSDAYDHYEANVAGIVGLTRYKSDKAYTLAIINCDNYGNMSGHGTASGIVGNAHIEGGTITLTVTDCTNNGEISGVYAGGIAGYVNYTTATISGCTNSGDISATGSCSKDLDNTDDKTNNDSYENKYVANAGGIVGYASGSLTIENCSNSGTVSATATANGTLKGKDSKNKVTYKAYANAGGIVGAAVGSYNISGTTTNTGSVSASVKNSTSASQASVTCWGNVGGIAGIGSGTGSVTGATNGKDLTSGSNIGGIAGYVDGALTITGGSNSGTIKGTAAGGALGRFDANSSISGFTNSGAVTGSDSAGGIVGRAGGNYTMSISNCTNTGTITSSYRAGGIYGFGKNNTTITNCVNGSATDATLGKVVVNGGDAWSGAAGILAYADGSATVKGCTNYGAVSANGNCAYTGGIVGRVGGAVTIGGTADGEACVNNGNITVTKAQYVGGILGYAGGKNTVTNCTNSGNILATEARSWTYLGGIVSYIDKNDSVVSGCKNLGDIEAKKYQSMCGGIVGTVTGSISVTIENCHNGSADVAPHLKGNNENWRTPMGGIIAHVSAGATAKVDGCTNYGTFEFTGEISKSTHMGGIIGLIEKSSATVENCANYADFSRASNNAESSVGGIVGSTRDVDGKTIKIIKCENYGDLSGGTRVGGIFGSSWLGVSSAKLVVEDCTNYGTITSTGRAGGIVAEFDADVALTNCTNSGKVTGPNVLGGIVGYAATANITGCVNEGEIVTTSTSGNETYIGGIAGWIKGGSISGCENNHEIVLSTCPENSNTYVGGIAGYAQGTITISECTNNKNVTATENHWYFGGIVGTTDGDVTVTHCENNGVISGKVDNSWNVSLGGIVSYSFGGKLTVRACVNNGDVVHSSGDGVNACMGGILGRSYNTTLTITDCINNADIYSDDSNTTGLARTSGGIIGMIQYNGTIVISNCVNAGEVSGKYAGGVLGQIWGCDGKSTISITNCQNRKTIYGNYAGGIVGGTDGGVTAITVDQCSNLGEIYADNAAGGILALLNSNCTATIKNSVNMVTVLGESGTYAIGPDNATITDCAYPMDIGISGGTLPTNILAVGDKNTQMMAFSKDALKMKIDEIDEFLAEVYKIPAKYDEFTIEDLEQALDHAKEIYNTEVWVLMQDATTNEWYAQILTQARVNEAFNRLSKAREDVLYGDQKIILLDRTIAEAEELFNSNDIYTVESWTDFTEALIAARDLRINGYVNADGSVTAIEDLDTAIIREYIAALRTSMSNLVLGGNIYTAEDFARLDGQKGTFYLMNDIEISAPVDNFAGKLIGNGFTITLNNTALFNNLDGESAIEDANYVKSASISDLTIVGDANGAASLLGKAYGMVTVSNVVIDVENVVSAALFNEAEKNAEISVVYVVTYANTADAALVSNADSAEVNVHYVLAMTDAPALVDGKGASTVKTTYLGGTVYYDEFGVSHTDANVFASGRVAYEMNLALAGAANADVADTTLVQILGQDTLPAVGEFMADGLNKVVKEKGSFINESYLYNGGVTEGDSVAPFAPVVSGLQSAIARAEALKADNYTEASWANMQAALEAAKKALTEAKTQVGIDNARKALDIAVASLIKAATNIEIVAPDYTALNAAIDAAHAFKYSDYTDATWSNLQAMLTMAKIAKRSMSQATVDSAAAALNGAIAGLVKAPVETEKAPATDATEPVADDKGCGSVIGGAAVLLTAVLALGAGISFKKKED